MEDIHLTIVQNQEVILKMCEAAWERFSKRQKLEEVAGEVMFLGSFLLNLFCKSLPTAPLVGVMIAGFAVEMLAIKKSVQR